MSRKKVLKFEDALADDEERANGRSVLLGNGFSIEWNPSVFRYSSLYNEAKLQGLSTRKEELFEALDTQNFEKVIEHLRAAAKLADLYKSGDPQLSTVLRRDAKVVRLGLADVIADRHPSTAKDVTDNEVESAREFLAHFDRIFTVNYDLLLYWVLNRSDNSKYHPPREDGFEWPTTKRRRKLIWKRKTADRCQRIFYLHGGLHLFIEQRRLCKLKYSATKSIIEQVRGRIIGNHYPLVVTEGSSTDKIARIGRSPYLTYVHRAFKELAGTLFIHGLSLSPNDDHIHAALESKNSQVETLYVSIHGNIFSDEAQDVMRRARLIQRSRRENGGRPLKLRFYDSESAHVWRES